MFVTRGYHARHLDAIKMCDLIDSIHVQYGDKGIWYCTYSCMCPTSGGGEPMVIEQTFQYYG